MRSDYARPRLAIDHRVISSARKRQLGLTAVLIVTVLVGVATGCTGSGETSSTTRSTAAKTSGSEPSEGQSGQPVTSKPGAAGSDEAPTALENSALSRPVTPVALPESEVPRAAIAAETRIRSIRSAANRTQEVQTIAASARHVLESVAALKDWMTSREPRQQTPRALRSLGQEWRIDGEALEAWMEATGRRLDTLAAARTELRGLVGTWVATGAQLESDAAPSEIQDRARDVLESIRRVEIGVDAEFDSVLLLQSRISAAKLDTEEALETIAAALREERRSLFRIESPPIWKLFAPDAGSQLVSGELRTAGAEAARAMRQYGARANRNLWFHFILFVLLVITFRHLRPKSYAWPADDRGLRACARLVQRPILGASLVALLLGPWIHPRAPLAFYELSSILLIVPVVVLMSGIVHPAVRSSLGALAVLFVAERLWETTWAESVLERTVLLGLTVLSAAVLAWTIRPRLPFSDVGARRWWGAVIVAARLALVALAISFAANVVGNVSLARMLTASVVRAAYVGVVLYAAALILRGAVALLVRSTAARTSHTIDRHGELILRRAMLAINLTVIFFFALSVVAAAGLVPVIRETLGEALAKPWGVGDVRFSLASALLFVAAIYASILVSRMMRAVLENDVYPRVLLPRGVPATLTMLARYSVISVGFFIALSIAGIPLDRLAIVLGAFSVGIGFGLQTVVHNFVSGLILMFERPIQIGDAIEVGGLVGRVRRIGVRASTIETFEGAEVIVPNGTLVSSQLINWTLSNRSRRIEIQVGVAYGTDSDKVLAILSDVPKGQPGVLSHPEPMAICRGFGPSSLDFSVLFWTADFDGWLVVRSEVTVRVTQALNEAGIEIPFPQQVVRIHR